jgi:hypothetical protein
MSAHAGAKMNPHATVRGDWRRNCYRVIAVAVMVGLGARPAVASTCVGDCRGNGTVDIAAAAPVINQS